MGVRLTEDEQRAFLEQGHTGIVTTLRRDGWPVSLPVWYAVVDGKVYLGTPPKSKKVARVKHDQRCSFLVESGEKWVDLIAVEFRATATIVEDAAEAEAAEKALAEKYAGFGPPAQLLPDATKKHYSARTVIRLDPTGPAISWNNQKIRLTK
jgi:PPOX class probable F420-dependent enzyme